MCQSHGSFLRFYYGAIAYKILKVLFDLSISPRVFSKVVDVALAPMRCHRLWVLAYLESMEPHDIVHIQVSHVQSLGFILTRKRAV